MAFKAATGQSSALRRPGISTVSMLCLSCLNFVHLKMMTEPALDKTTSSTQWCLVGSKLAVKCGKIFEGRREGKETACMQSLKYYRMEKGLTCLYNMLKHIMIESKMEDWFQRSIYLMALTYNCIQWSIKDIVLQPYTISMYLIVL